MIPGQILPLRAEAHAFARWKKGGISPALPFGGMKASGVGRVGGVHSLELFSESRNVCIKIRIVESRASREVDVLIVHSLGSHSDP